MSINSTPTIEAKEDLGPNVPTLAAVPPPQYHVGGDDSAAAVNSVFAKLDNSKISWFHIKTVIVAGMGFFCDSYDLFSISLVSKTIGRIYYPDPTYQCVPCPAADTCTWETSTTHITDPTTGLTALSANCRKILLLNAVDYVGPDPAKCPSAPTASCGIFNSGFDAYGTGWDQSVLTRYNPGATPAQTTNAINAIALIGTLCGQLLFGFLGDIFGRRQVFGVTLYIMTTFCFMQAFSFGSSSTAVISTLLAFRFFLGVGIGGDYPLAATLMSEYSSKSSRGSFIAAVFAMQGIGYLVAATWAIILAAIFNARVNEANPDHYWRMVLAFGAIPTAATIYARLNLPETPRYTMFVNANATQLVDDMNYVLQQESLRSAGNVAPPVSLRRNTLTTTPPVLLKVRKTTYLEFFSTYGMTLFATSSCWFLLDIAFYSQNLFQSDVFTAAGWLPTAYTMTILSEAYNIARAQAIIALASTVPGYWVTVFTIERLGRWKIQLMGFFFMTLFMAVLAGDYYNLQANSTGGFVTLYALTFFFANFGPNSTTFILPAEVFPTQFRTMGHGFSAAWGKTGSIIGTFGFGTMKTNVSLQAALGLLAGVNGLGMLITAFLIPETTGLSLEELSKDSIIASKTKTLEEGERDATSVQTPSNLSKV